MSVSRFTRSGAALQCFHDLGYEKTTIADIKARANVRL
jgi:AcrR family transcriptional regulator